jgi:hypothetical protein
VGQESLASLLSCTLGAVLSLTLTISHVRVPSSSVLRSLTGPSDFTTPVFAWTMVEASLAVVGANLPLLRPLLHRTTYTSSSVWSLLRSMRSRRSETGSDSDVHSETKVEHGDKRSAYNMAPIRSEVNQG